MPSHGSQSALGAGIRLGALWQATPGLDLGVSYKSRTRMGAFSGYKDEGMFVGIWVPSILSLGALLEARR